MKPIDEILRLGCIHHREGRLADAAAVYQDVLHRHPDHPHALHLLGVAKLQSGDAEQACKLMAKAVAGAPQVMEFYKHLGCALEAAGRPLEALDCYRRALALQPDSADILLQLGRAQMAQGMEAEAFETLQHAVQQAPDNVEALTCLGRACLHLPDQLCLALRCFQKVCRLEPSPSAWNDLGFAAKSLGNLDEAARAFETALSHQPRHKNAWNNLSTVYKSLGRCTEAADACRRALEIDPEFAVASCNLGVALSAMGRQQEAHQALQQALAQWPDYARAHSHLLFNMQYRTGITERDLFESHQQYQRQHAAKIKFSKVARDPAAGRTRPLSVAFVSDGLGRHPVGYFLVGLLEHLDDSQIRVTCYADRNRNDELSQRIQRQVQVWHQVSGWSNERLARQIESDKIDVLFDLMGHVGGQRLLMFARRAAPIQMTWMGYVGTTGVSNMDYLLADEHHVPVGCETLYTERLLRMPDDYICYTPPSYAPRVDSLPAQRHGYITFGSFNQPAKLNPPLIGIWSDILRRVPGSRLLLAYGGFEDRGVRGRLLELFSDRGVDPSRIDLQGKLPHEALLAAYNQVDIGLDTAPYSGGLTTCEAIWMGVPVITKVGETFAGRHSTSHLRNTGLAELVADSWQGYQRLALDLSRDLEYLGRLRDGMRARVQSSALCDASRFACQWMKLLHSL